MVPLVVFRAHGLGNDYLVLVEGPPLDPPLVQRLCDRHRGVGSDGILEPSATDRADHGVRIWNPDGSIAEKSGNGIRIFAWWLHHHRSAPTTLSVDTGHDVVQCIIDGDRVEVEMGRARHAPAVDLDLDGERVRLHPVDLGNPHAVLWTGATDLDPLPWRAWGAQIEIHPRFPHRTNVQVARRIGASACEARIWERGAGPTQASGSSACAVAAVAVHLGHQPLGTQRVHMPGGVLDVTVRADHTIRLAGPVAPIATIEVDPRWWPGPVAPAGVSSSGSP